MRALAGLLALAAPIARPGQTLSPGQSAALAAIRAYALDYTARLPDYTCIQVTKRRTMPAAGAVRPRPLEVIEEQLTFSNHHESYQVLTFNGEKAVGVQHDQITGAVVTGEFGGLLFGIFDPRNAAIFKFAGTDKNHGHPLLILEYQVPSSAGMRLEYGLPGPGQVAYTAAFEGQVYADAQTRQVLRITQKCIGLPAGFPVREVRLTLEYKPVMVAGQKYTLPFHSEVRWHDIRSTVLSEIDYRQYRKFVSDATLKFDGDNDGKK